MATSKLPCELAFAIEPAPASRPRVGKFGTFYSGSYKTWMAEALKLFPKDSFETQLEGAISVSMIVRCTKAKTSKLMFPRGDVDNYAKGPLDILTKAGLWGDDTQVVRLSVTKRFTAPGETPGITVRISKGD